MAQSHSSGAGVDGVSVLSKHSRKLASQKEEKDKRIIAEMLQLNNHPASLLQRRMAVTTNSNSSNSGISSDEESGNIGGSGVEEGQEDEEGGFTSTVNLSHSSMMVARGMLMEQRKEQRRQQLLDQEAQTCTFRPAINSEGPFVMSPSLSKRIRAPATAYRPVTLTSSSYRTPTHRSMALQQVPLISLPL